MLNVFDPTAFLYNLKDLPDGDIDLATAAIALAALGQPGISTDRYFTHLKKISRETTDRYAELLREGSPDQPETMLAALNHVIVGIEAYKGDNETPDDLQNASLIRTIERRKGSPLTLAILYLQAGRQQGWDIAGLDFPGHFLCRLEKDGRRIIFNPFNKGAILEAAGLRSLLKRVRGLQAELSATYFEPATNRQILMRLQNNIKYRQIEAEDYAGALKTVETMRLVDPAEFRLLLDAGVLYARTNQTRAAIETLEEYIKKAPHDRDRHEAGLFLQELKNTLH